MDNRLPPTGYTPPESHKLCIRCGELNDCEFQLLCDACRLNDEYHVSETRQLENDHLAEISFARMGH